ncbi:MULTISPECIES: hypothetical protein [unclassified Sedimentibacter]|uniref:hypothetical protein n=1 Tax=unclassified Sedimentibacter TaxID=2649220 RepID=UPI0027DF4F1E|nr:hypothetical protein [Sedimentibacter sp. MB35-C1]WMJ75871.1 hypothetical protein RBQ61_09530 [Sedimentibacter sp. MB35-C1]
MNNNYKIVRTIFENVFQRVLECKDNDTGDVFYSNVITSRKIINLINLEELKKIPSNILECFNTEDRIYIYTKPLKAECKGLKEYLDSSLTLKQQFALSENVINLAQNIFNMTDIVQQKILDTDKLYVDSENNIYADCNLIFEQEYDIADNETFKRLGNIIHFIFAGSEIIDYNISDSIPPDILKIIVRCLTKEYIFPNDVIGEMKKSPIYAMIFGEKTALPEYGTNEEIKPDTVIEQEDLNTAYEESALGEYDDDGSVLDIYVNDSRPVPEKNNKNQFNKKELIRIVLTILVVVIVLFLGNKIIKSFNKADPANSDNTNGSAENETPPEVPPASENQTGDEESPAGAITDSTEVYFNDNLLTSIGYTGNKAGIDDTIYVEGKNSLVVSNETDEKIKSLFAAVNFGDDKFSYMLKKQIGIAAKMKSETDVTAQVVIEAYKDGSLTSNFHTNTKISNDIWSQFTVPINVTDADSLNIYIEYEGKNKIWIDSINIDVIK